MVAPDERMIHPRGYLHSDPVPESITDPLAFNDYFCSLGIMNTNDGNPDVFNFNVNGYSGEFFFSQDGTPHLVPYQNIKIETLDGDAVHSFNAFRITTPDGIQYLFGQADANGISTREQTISYNNCYDSNPDGGSELTANSAWYLNKVIHPNGEEIQFNYVRNEVEYSLVTSETAYQLLPTEFPPQNGDCDPVLPNNICMTTLESSTPKLSSIHTEFHRVEFLHTSGRQDLFGGILLDKIMIKSNSGEILQSFDLEQDYFTGSHVAGGPYATYDRYHLRLKAIHQNCQPSYWFEYLGDGVFPSRLSKARDHWGYYNGAVQNSSLIPQLVNNHEVIGSANREPDEAAMQMGTLHKITYPTGGYTELEYEAHQYGNFAPINQQTEENIYLSSVAGTGGSQATESTTSFTVTGSPAQGVFEADFDLGGGFPDPELLYARVEKVISGSSNEVIASFVVNSGSTVIELDLVPGDYLLITGATELNSFATLQGIISEVIALSTPITSIMAGGIRVRKMTDHSASNAPAVVRDFVYETERSGLIHSSGWLNQQPNYIGSVLKKIYPIPEADLETFAYCDYQSFTSASNTPLFYQSGSPVGYEEVKVSIAGNGQTIYKYNTAEDEGFTTFPFPPFVSRNWKKGLLLEKVETGAGGTRIEQNTYRFDTTGIYGWAPGLTVRMAWKHPWIGACGEVDHPSTYQYAYHTYERISPAVFLDRKTVIQDGVETITDYTYNPQTLNPIITEMANSDGKVYRTETDYAEEVQNSCLTSRFIHSIPVESRQYVDNQLTGGSQTSFTEVGTMCLPTAFFQTLSDSTQVLRGTASYYTATCCAEWPSPKLSAKLFPPGAYLRIL